ncbi:MAG: amidohydrolase [Planctomycetota bacterium]
MQAVNTDETRACPAAVNRRIALLALFHVALAQGGFAQEPQTRPTADLLIVNAKVWTAADGKSAGQPGEPTAIAVTGNKIAAVGTDAEIRALAGGGARTIDAAGRRVIPGMTDSHVHLIGGGFQLHQLDLRGAANRGEFVKAIGEAAKAKKPKEWVTGGRWSVESWPNPESPQAVWIDAVTGDVPVFLPRMDGHQALVNSVALKHGGIDSNGPMDPAGGEIERDPTTRQPTGILKESAMDLVRKLIPPPTDPQRSEALSAAMRHANSLGVTSVHAMAGFDELKAFRRAAEEKSLTVRITAYLSVDDWWLYLEEMGGNRFGLRGPMASVVGFKGYMDGSLGSRNAYMREPFADAASTSPYPRGQLNPFASSPEAFLRSILNADKRNAQIAVHAIGDEANHLLLDAYEQAIKQNGRSGALHRIEHAQHLLLEDIPRFAKLGVVSSMQPFHKADDGRYAEKALGRSRLAGSYAFRQLVDSKALLIFGSDWPVVNMNPFSGIDAAVNSRTLSGEVWLPDHSLTLEEALRAYTAWPARAIHRERELGTIETGKFADLVMLTDDPFTMPGDRIGQTRVALTIVDGKIAYEAEKE